MLELRLLGPVEAYSAEGVIPLGGAKPRALIAALALDRGHVVSASRLVDVLWPRDPPESARSLVQTYISTLRKSLADHGITDVIATRSPGYLIRPGSATVDVDTFTRLTSEASGMSKRGDHGAAAALLREAIGLWRGPALSGLEEMSLSPTARRLEELLISAQEDRFTAELQVGGFDHHAELAELVSRHPTNERLRGHLMVSLYRMGRQAEALTCYREGREALVGELGVEPGPDLAALHSAILRHEEGLRQDPASSLTTVIPAHLPAALPDFTGRQAELERITTGLNRRSPGTHILTGPGGSGKSVLATFAAHRCIRSFPDGQLFAELRGTAETPAAPAEVLGSFLRCLGIDTARQPKSTRERAELFRSLVAGRRMLVVLDDAANEAQVRPLLPGGPACGVVVTSRYRLAGLAGATRTDLDVMPDLQAYELLVRIIGQARAEADPEAGQRILAACENLPLAIRIAGARLASRPQLPLRVLADRLADERMRLNELSAGDLAVRASIELSYRALPAQAKATLRRTGFLGIAELSASVAGWLLDTDEAHAERLLETLVDAQLVTFTGIDPLGVLRYRMHDLVRLFASERAEAEEPATALTASVARVIRGWHGVVQGLAASSPPAETVWQPVSGTASTREMRGALPDVFASLRAEEECVAVVVERAAGLGMSGLVAEFVSARIAVEPEGANRFDFRDRIIGAALSAAQRAGDVTAEATMLAELGQMHYAQDCYRDARHCFNEAYTRFRRTADARGQAAALTGMGTACRESGQLAQALHFLERAASLLLPMQEGAALGYVFRLSGSVRLEQGDFPGALADVERSLRWYRAAGSSRGIALTLRTLGLYHRANGDYAEAMRVCERSATIFRECDDELMLSYAVRAHAKAQLRAGDAEEALVRLEWALSVARTFHDRWGQACTLRVLGQLHLSQERLALAESYLEAARSLWMALESPIWLARTLHDLSLLYGARGDLPAQRAAGSSALRCFREHGAREFAELSAATPRLQPA